MPKTADQAVAVIQPAFLMYSAFLFVQPWTLLPVCNFATPLFDHTDMRVPRLLRELGFK